MILSYSGIGAANNLPSRHELGWPTLVEWLRTDFYERRGPGPKDGPWLSFADYAGTDSEGRTGIRSYECLVASHAVPLDLDLGQYVWTAADITARLAGFQFVAWTSYSHAPERPRWRIVVPVAAPMSREQHYATWETLAALFAHDCGTSSKDATRLNYLPGACLHPDAAQLISGDGIAFPVSAVPEGTAASQAPVSDGPVPGYNGPTDDDALLAYMLTRINGPKQAFGSEPTFADLWNANGPQIALAYPPEEHGQEFEHTRADAALANELAYYTGGDEERVVRLMCRAPLCDRPKWREDKARRAYEIAMAGRTQYAFMAAAPAPTAESTPSDPGTNDPTGGAAAPHTITQPGDFFAYLPQHDYIHRPTGMHWPAASLDGTVGKDARMMLDITLPVHLESWAPGFPERFQYAQLDETRPRAAESWVYNYYQAPRTPRVSGDIQPWLDLVHKLYPSDAEHIVRYFADAVQNPGRKTNHALVLGSEVHGIGKDSMLRPLKWAVGERNYASINPAEIFDKNNAWAASVVVQISESRNVGDGDGHRISKYDMYERCKDLAAAPPTTLSCQDKWKARHEVRNCCRVIYTTNHGVDGIYLPPQDRRHYCAWSDAAAMSEADSLAFHKWCDAGGAERVAHYLTHLDISTWNPGARPPQTAWWWRLVREAEGDENPLSEAIERMGAPLWLTAEQLAKEGGPTVAAWFADVRNRKNAGRHLGTLGYRRVENPADKRGRFNIGQVRVTVYGKPDVTAEIINRGR